MHEKNTSFPNASVLAVVSGAASGIGLATIRALAQSVSVLGVDRAAMPADLESRDSVSWVRGDVSSPGTWAHVCELVRERELPAVEIAVLCAADVVVAPFLQTAHADWRRLFEVNVMGAVLALQTLMPEMVKRRRGAIAVVCSVDSLYTEEGLAAYAASKAALLNVVRSAAIEHARDRVRVNAVCPGAVNTPLLEHAIGQTADPAQTRGAIERRTPSGKILAPEEVAAVLCFLVSDNASGLSGAAVTVDGGLTATYDFGSA